MATTPDCSTADPVPKHPDLIYDVGLHHGEDTDFYLRKGFRVVAFEANPDNAAYCRERFKKEIARHQLTIVAGAITEHPAGAAAPLRVPFFQNVRSTWGTVRADWASEKAGMGAPSTVIEVDAVDFGAALRQYGIPHYLKLDVEGCEGLCLETLRSFSERPDYVSIESVQSRFVHVRREVDLLRDLGYDGFKAVNQHEVADEQPPYPPREGDYVPYRFEEGSTGLFGEELPGPWDSRKMILRRYRLIRLSAALVDRFLWKWKIRGFWRLGNWIHGLIRRLSQVAVSSWYDTHARLASRISPAAPRSSGSPASASPE